MRIDETQITAKVYKQVGEMYLVNVGFPDIGFYIGSITVRPSPKYPERGPWVQPPKYQAKGKWISPLEFSKDSTLWPLIETAAREAVSAYNNQDVIVTAEDVDNFDPEEAFKDIPP
jgi:hypothetical protein